MRRFVCILIFAAGCSQSGIDSPAELPEMDEHYYRCNVQPVLAARCSFMACHGADERPLRIYAEQRLRLDVPWTAYETPLTEDELAANLLVVRGFVGADNLLADKPLDTRAGGRFHRGRDLYGTDDVFLSDEDPGYQILRAFGGGASADPGCVPTEEVGL